MRGSADEMGEHKRGRERRARKWREMRRRVTIYRSDL